MSQSPDQMLQSMIANLPQKTGNSLDQWLKLLRSHGLQAHKEIMGYLKTEHGMTHGYANLVSQMARKPVAADEDSDRLIAAQYGGAKEGLRPIYEKLAAAVHEFGADVELSPKKAYVSLRRRKQFALIQPSTRTRVDVGVNFKGRDATPRLEPSGSFNAMVSHRVRVSDASEVNPELIQWLREAYEEA